jgi:translation elongation factor P/translation initiation factor 5A
MKLVKIVSLVMFFACSSVTFILASANPAMAEDDDGSLAAKIKMITDRKWTCYEYFEDFNSLKAEMIWKAGRPGGNKTDLSLVVIEFHQDNTFDQVNETGEKVKGKWRFLKNGAVLETTIGTTVKTMDVRKLNQGQLDYSNSNNEYCVMRSFVPGIDPTHTKMEMMTGNMWKYGEYVENYDEKEAHVIWHMNKYMATTDMGKMRFQFLNNGTFNQTDVNGTVGRGKWRFINNDTQVELITDGGTITDYIVRTLTPNLVELVTVDGKLFAQLIPANE